MTRKIITGSYERDIVLKILLNCNNVGKNAEDKKVESVILL